MIKMGKRTMNKDSHGIILWLGLKPTLGLKPSIRILEGFGSKLWNQGLVNLDFDDKKTRFRTNDHISSVIRQDDFQSDNHKDKSSQGEIMKKKTTSKRRVFQNQSFLRSLCKVVGVLGLSCISFFIYSPKSSKSNIVLNILRIGWFHVFN